MTLLNYILPQKIGRAAALCIALFVTCMTFADDNPYRISQECYRLYSDGLRHRGDKLALAYSDSIMQASSRLNDKRARLFAYLLPLYYYSEVDDKANMHVAADNLRAEARKQNDKSYYYHAYDIEIYSHIMSYDMMEATHLASEMRDQANMEGFRAGVMGCNKNIALIYTRIGDNESASKYYKLAIEEAKQLKDNSISYLYRCLASVTDKRKDRDKYYDISLSLAKTELDSLGTMLDHCLFAGNAEHKKSFYEKYDQLKKYISKVGVLIGNNDLYQIECMKAAFDGNYELAHAYADSVSYIGDQINMHILTAKQHDYKLAYNLLVQGRARHDSIASSHTDYNIAAFTSKTENIKVSAAAHEQELALAKLRLKEADIEQEDMKLTSQWLVMERESHAREYESMLLIEDSISGVAKIAAQEQALKRAQADKKLKQASNIRLLLAIIVGFFILAVAYFFVRNYQKRRSMRKLMQLYHMLHTARNKAVAADKLQNAFIQNMNHEVRTPLQTVIGFSQVLADEEISISDKDKAEYSKYIYDAASQLNDQLDKILETARNEALKH